MIKNLLLPFAGVFLFILVVGLLVKNPGLLGLKIAPSPSPSSGISKITVGGKEINVTIADTADKRVKGLSGVTYLPGDSGMLFVFEQRQVDPKFWMKGMLIPLDIIWISKGKIVSIDRSIPVPDKDTPDNKITSYSSPVPVDYVLEVNSGFSNLNNIAIGDPVIIN